MIGKYRGAVPYGLHVEEESHQEADEDREVLDGEAEPALVPQHRQERRATPVPIRHQKGDQRAQHDGRRGEEGRCHDVVPQRLDCQDTVLRRILRRHQSAREIQQDRSEMIINRPQTDPRNYYFFSSRKFYLHHGSNPEAAVDGVHADNGLGRVLHDPAEEPQVISHHYDQAEGDEGVIEKPLFHGCRVDKQNHLAIISTKPLQQSRS